MRKLKGYYGLEYITVKFPEGDVHASVMQDVEERVSRYIVEHRSPIRGVELRFLRKTMGFSLAALAEKLEVTPPTIKYWEDELYEKLDARTEVSVRILFAELLGVTLPSKFSELRGTEEPKPKEFKAA